MKIHTIKGYIQNIFLVEYAHGCMLLDGCCRADVDILKVFFKETLQRPIKDLKVILVTHMHPDHAGGANSLRRISGAKVYTLAFSKQWYNGIKGFFSHVIDIALAYYVANRTGQPIRNLWYSGRIRPDAMLNDNQAIPNFEDWTTVATPGHTDRDMSVVNHDMRQIYVADVIVSVKGKYYCPFPVYMPNEYRLSLTKLERYTGYEMMMAHVPNVTLCQNIIDEVLSKAPKSPRTARRFLHAKFVRAKQLVQVKG